MSAHDTDFAALGIIVTTTQRVHVRTTCPQCSDSRRKRQNRCLVANTESGLFYCHHCGYKGKAGGATSQAERPTLRPPPSPNESHRRRLQRTWQRAHPLEPPDPVMRYLAQRGLMLPPNQIPTVLRYHPQLRYTSEDETQPAAWHPGMVARIDDAQGHPVNLHRTYLTLDGHKAAVSDVRKWMTPAVEGSTKGGAIRLYRPGDTLALAEGIETALAVHLSTGLPVWAALCASLLKEVVIPSTVSLVVICADHDRNRVGLDAAQHLAQRLLREGRRCKVLVPERVGTDWLDVYTDTQAPQLTLERIAATPDVMPSRPHSGEGDRLIRHRPPVKIAFQARRPALYTKRTTLRFQKVGGR